MLLFIGKIIILYFFTISIIRLMGKSAFAQLTAHDLAGIFFVISIAAGPVVTESFLKTIVGLTLVGLIHVGFSKLMLVNWINRIFIGKPTIVIKHGKLIKANLKWSTLSLAEILSEVREKGYPDITLIEHALIEPNGAISVIPKQNSAPVTPAQMGMKMDYQGVPISVVVEGRIQHKNLSLANLDEQTLRNKLDQEGYPDLQNIFYAAVRDHDHSLTIDTGDGERV
ncbi:DUF421 domain-containing protein [Lentibacillus halophilus]|uniref:DUF421 domain-containing protein n=1 Tax=Lentibacillus halophilus TaxID=295065 RepID=A0ABN0Z4I2_9BACI